MKQRITREYAVRLQEQYPDLQEADIARLLTYFMRQLYGHVRGGNDILISAPARKTNLKIYKRDFNVPRANARAKRLRARIQQIRSNRHNDETKGKKHI
jgi:hypothetical protein